MLVEPPPVLFRKRNEIVVMLRSLSKTGRLLRGRKEPPRGVVPGELWSLRYQEVLRTFRGIHGGQTVTGGAQMGAMADLVAEIFTR